MLPLGGVRVHSGGETTLPDRPTRSPNARNDAAEPAPGPYPSVRLPNPVEAAERQRQLLVRLLRIAFFVLFLTVLLLSLIATGQSGDPNLAPMDRFFGENV